MLGEVPDVAQHPSQHCDLQATLVVEVDVHRSDRQIVVIVKSLGQALRQLTLLVIIDVDECCYARLSAILPVLHLGHPCPGEIADRFGSVLIAAITNDPVERCHKLVVEGMVMRCIVAVPRAQNTVGFQTRTDDIHIDLAETMGRMVRFTVRDDHVIEASAGLYLENRIQWLDKFRTVTGLREDLYYGSDESTLQANSGTIVQAITSPKGNLVFGPWNQTEYYLSVGQGFHSNDLRGALTTVDALQTEINQMQGNPTVVPQVKTPPADQGDRLRGRSAVGAGAQPQIRGGALRAQSRQRGNL